MWSALVEFVSSPATLMVLGSLLLMVSGAIAGQHPKVAGLLAAIGAYLRGRQPPAAMLLLVPFLLPAGRATAADAKTPAEAVVKVSVAQFGGSGVCVHSGPAASVVLTNTHITDSAPGAVVYVTTAATRHEARLIAADRAEDLAVLVVAAELPAAPLAREEPAAGESVTLYGYAWTGQGKLVSKSGTAAPPDSLGRFRSTIACVSGDSGGGVFNARGELVAVNHGFEGSYERRGLQLGVRLAAIRPFAGRKAGCVCGADCACKPGECPSKCPVAPRQRPAAVAPAYVPPACQGGVCPAPQFTPPRVRGGRFRLFR